MVNKDKLEEIGRKIREAENRLHREQQRERMLEHQMKVLTRKERTHRLCTRGAILESYFPHPESVTDDQIKSLLNVMFHRANTRELFQKMIAEEPETQEVIFHEFYKE